MKTFLLRMDAELHKKLKMKAAEKEETLHDYIIGVLRDSDKNAKNRIKKESH